jgi:hypothetical protein
MNCANHPEMSAVAYCRACGKALCQNCQKTAQGTVFCEEHMPVETVGTGTGQASYSPYTAHPTVAPPPPPYAPPHLGVSPGLAFILGLIPGVGAIYNGQYAKGLIHGLLFGALISIGSGGAFDHASGPMFGVLLTAFYFYMPFEAYHTAKRRQLGEHVDEFSSIFPTRGRQSRVPIGPIVLIAVGLLFLFNNLGWLNFYEIARFWPVFLIALGAYLLYTRLTAPSVVGPEAANEQR